MPHTTTYIYIYRGREGGLGHSTTVKVGFESSLECRAGLNGLGWFRRELRIRGGSCTDVSYGPQFAARLSGPTVAL